MVPDPPPPPIDPEVDLTDFSFMPLDVRRLRDSKLATTANGEGFRCAVLLWCAAWHQIPAGSLPDDDTELCSLAGYGRAIGTWKKIRANALRGFSKASDGRLYHPVVVEKALDAWKSKLDQQYRRECDRLRKENKRRFENKEESVRIPSFDEWNSERTAKGIPQERSDFPPDVLRNSSGRLSDSVLKGQGRDREGTGKGQGHSLSAGVGVEPVPVADSAGREGKAIRDPDQAWRDVETCDHTAYQTWLEWRASEYDTVPSMVRIRDAKFVGGKGTPEQQRVFVDELIRRRFKRLHDPIGNVNGGGTTTGRKTAADHERESAARLVLLPGEDPGPM